MATLNGKVVLITGAGKGSGRLLAEAFARHGALLALNDISPIHVEPVVERILAEGGHAKAYIEDVAKKVAAQSIINQVEDDFGRLDILVNHAAVEPAMSVLDMDEWDWHRTLDVNLTGAFLMTQSAGRLMRARGRGTVINLITRLTNDGNRDRGSQQGKAAFLASMNGLEGFTRQAAWELHPYGVEVHAVENVSANIVATVFTLLDVQMEER
jgi:NAD(P)-dependent dehydrogenase (short-subunit alcohol dehydrogenase family)